MKTKMNQQAGEAIAGWWLTQAERIIASGGSPAPLSTYTRFQGQDILANWHRSNSQWFLGDHNWPKVLSAAVAHAKHVLTVIGAERYPLTLAHFTAKKKLTKELQAS